MATTRAELQRWFDEGARDGYRYMIVKTDWLDHQDYPAYARDRSAAERIVATGRNRNTEVYDLEAERGPQLNAQRVWALDPHDPAIKPRPVKRKTPGLRVGVDVVTPYTAAYTTPSRAEVALLRQQNNDLERRLAKLEKKLKKLAD